MSIESQGVQTKTGGILQIFDSSGEDKQLLETRIVNHSGELVSTTEAIALDDAKRVAHEQLALDDAIKLAREAQA